MTAFHLDYETRSEIPLDERGLDNYSRDKSTSVILAAYAEGDHKVKLWEPHLSPMPTELKDALTDPWVQVHAWNSAFELAITRYVLKIHKPASEWVDPMSFARYLSLPGSLEDVGEILKIGEAAKMKEGKRLINLFCEPELPAGRPTLFGLSEATFRDWRSDPADWDLFGQYCKQDVVAERTIEKKLVRFHLPDDERETWLLDSKINARGIPVDLDLVRGAKLIADREMERLRLKLHNLTHLDNTNSNSQMLKFLQKNCGYPFASLGKAFVGRAMEGEGGLSDLGREILEIRKMTSKSSLNKFEVIANTVSDDGRLRNQFVYYGAARTGRWSGRDAQLQNLPRPTKEVENKMDRAVELVRKVDYEAITKEFSQPLDVASSVIRAGFRAPEGFELVVADLGSIETRVVGFVARCKAILDIFEKGQDAYLMFGTRMFNKPYDQVTKEERQKAKAPVLGCGFGLGGGEEQTTESGDVIRTGLWGYAQAMGVELTQAESAQAVKVYRETYPEVPVLWKELHEGAVSAIRHPGKLFEVGPLGFECMGKKVLRMILPSGRALHYINPKVETRERDGKYGPYKVAEISYDGKDQTTHSWGMCFLIGSKICENAVQAIARDVLVSGMKEATKIGFKIVLHVHDEIGALVPIGSSLGLPDLIRCMIVQPWWTNGKLPLSAEGYTGRYYKK